MITRRSFLRCAVAVPVAAVASCLEDPFVPVSEPVETEHVLAFFVGGARNGDMQTVKASTRSVTCTLIRYGEKVHEGRYNHVRVDHDNGDTCHYLLHDDLAISDIPGSVWWRKARIVNLSNDLVALKA